jgi:hydrogenase/urease accessory protein HupE
VTRAVLVFLAVALLGTPAAAHEARPLLLQLTEREPGLHDVLLKVPARGELRLTVDAVLPETCEAVTPPRRVQEGSAWRDTWTVRCVGSLGGEELALSGLEGTLTDALVRLQALDGSERVLRLIPAAPAVRVPETPSSAGVAGAYSVLGVEHILLGIDHLLFVLGLMLLIRSGRKLLLTVTAFTVAHSLTLAAATLGWVRAPVAAVEAVIALSIVFVAAEVVNRREGRPGATAERPWIAAFGFGLLHGFGFAGALAEIGLPESAIPLALLFFNLGVEAGQLLFLGGVLGVLALVRGLRWRPPVWAWRVPAYTIGSLAAFWTLERTLALWS